NASFSGAKNGDATSTAISCAPAGNFSSRGCASQAYSRFANGSKATNTSSSPATPRSNRERSSTRCATRLPAPSSAALIGWCLPWFAAGIPGHVGGGVAQGGAGLADRGVGLVEALAQVLGREFAFQFVAHRMPLRAGAPRPEPGEARRARSEEHTSELQSRENLVCRLLLEKKKTPTL